MDKEIKGFTNEQIGIICNKVIKLSIEVEELKSINKELKEQLTLTDVSQQRELLNFLKWYDEDVEYNSKQTHEQLILSYAQKFNCC